MFFQRMGDFNRERKLRIFSKSKVMGCWCMQGSMWSEPFDSKDRSCKSYQEVKYIFWPTNHVDRIKK